MSELWYSQPPLNPAPKKWGETEGDKTRPPDVLADLVCFVGGVGGVQAWDSIVICMVLKMQL